MHKKKKGLYGLSALLVPMLLLIGFFAIRGYVPFGHKTIVQGDAYRQYIQLFGYLKDVLAGKSALSYSLSKGLGGENIGVFSYYLASPFNLLVVFFQKSQLISFYTLLVILKLGLASLTMYIYLTKRFEKLNSLYATLLGIGFALSQYGIAQSRSIMWLDGMYMMPLMMLGVYQSVHQRKPYLLAISTGLSIIFNWYVGAINCLFSIGVAAFELLVLLADHEGIKAFFKGWLNYIFAMAVGVILSCVLFYPTYLAMTTSSRSTFDFSYFASVMRSNMLSVIPYYRIGTISTAKDVSLYSGTLALLGTLGIIYSRNIKLSKKIISILFMALILLCLYYQPLYMVFSLFVNPESFWCRFSYIGTASLTMLSGLYFSKRNTDETPLMIGAFVFVIAFLILLRYFHMPWDVYALMTAGIILVEAIILDVMNFQMYVPVLKIVTCIAVMAELLMNINGIYQVQNTPDARIYQNYVTQGLKQIAAIQKQDHSFYRISQTNGMEVVRNNLNSFYDDAYLMNYRSLTSYVSTQNSHTLLFLNALGYKNQADRMTIVNSSILAADSLLGAKYIMSKTPSKGLKKTAIPGYNGRTVYENPYVFPQAFTYKKAEVLHYDGNPFRYANSLFSMLYGKKITLYKELKSKTQKHGKSYTYTVHLPKKHHYAVYGKILAPHYMNATLNVNGNYETDYMVWLAPQVFPIPYNKQDQTASVTMTYEKEVETKAEYYALDLHALKKVQQALKKRTPAKLSITDTKITAQVEGKAGEKLYIGVPADANLTLYINGKKTKKEKCEEAMISVPLEEGKNNIVITARVRGLKKGSLMSVIGVLMLLLYALMMRRLQRREARV